MEIIQKDQQKQQQNTRSVILNKEKLKLKIHKEANKDSLISLKVMHLLKEISLIIWMI